MAARKKAGPQPQLRKLRKSLDREKSKSAGLAAELGDALKRQAATAGILKVISRSPSDVQPVFDVILKYATRLCGAHLGLLALFAGGKYKIVASLGANREYRKNIASREPVEVQPGSAMARSTAARKPVQVLDVRQSENYRKRVPQSVALVELGGARSYLQVPMLKKGAVVGSIAIFRPEVRPFTQAQLDLVSTFASQAVIAIENVRLFNETKEALEQQTASNEILGVISSSPTDLAPVFDAILEGATRLCDAHLGVLNLYDGENFRTVAQRGGNPEFAKWIFDRGAVKPGSGASSMIAERRPVQFADVKESPAYREGIVNVVKFVELGGVRTYLAVPLVKDDRVKGGIVIYRPEVRPFTEKQIELVKTFANQAVIAIENVRLFNETKEALEQQTATAEILQAISRSPTDVRPVFEAIVRSGVRLFKDAAVAVTRPDGDKFQLMAIAEHDPELAAKWAAAYPTPVDRAYMHGAAILDCAMVEMNDALQEEEGERFPEGRRKFATTGYRAMTVMPMVRDGVCIGTISVVRVAPGPLSEKQKAVLRTFADQAVIAIENVRLFNETKEALERQTATADILRVISGSPTDIQPVLRAVAESAARLCDATDVIIRRVEGDMTRVVEHIGAIRAAGMPLPNSAKLIVGRAIRECRTIHIHDVTAPEILEEYPERLSLFQRGVEYRTALVVPMVKDGRAVGAIVIRRAEMRPFSEQQIKLLQTFADQAVIAIENVRLFNETKEALERQTATAEILSSISSAIANTQPVFDAIVQSLRRLFNTPYAVVTLIEDGKFVLKALAGEDRFTARVRAAYPWPVDDDGMVATRAIKTGQVIQLCPIVGNPQAPQKSAELAKAGGYNSIVIAPLMRNGVAIGYIVTPRLEAVPFNEKQVALIKSFADQAVIAIENVRLFNETKEALERQTATAEILRVIASSPSDVQPVFDAIARSAMQLLGGYTGAVARVVGDSMHLEALTTIDESSDEALRKVFPAPLSSGSGNMARAIRGRTPRFIADVDTDPDSSTEYRELARARGFRSSLAVPMLLRGGEAIGAISVTRRESGQFSNHQIELLKTFADQAVIAIENVRLFNETKEALERQTATAEILKVIASSPSDVQPVFDAVAKSAARLCDADDVLIRRRVGDVMPVAAHYGDVAVSVAAPALARSSVSGRAMLDRRTLHIPDLDAPGISDEYPEAPALRRVAGYRAQLAVPMVRNDEAIGVIMLRRMEVRPFTDKQISLLETFANQSVIAIENVRLFNETKEALERQTATAEILKVIASSPSDVQPVFDAILDGATRLCDAHLGVMNLLDGENYRTVAQRGGNPEFAKWAFGRGAFKPTGGLARLIEEREPHQVADIRDSDFYRAGNAIAIKFAELGGARSLLMVPLLKENQFLGNIAIYRPEVRPFEQKQIDLVSTFASQAVIAIENVRLFNETKEALERQTATAEILKVISSSPTDTQPVFDVILENATRLCDAHLGLLGLYDGEKYRTVAHRGGNADFAKWVLERGPFISPQNAGIGRMIAERQPVHISDLRESPAYKDRNPLLVPLVELGGARAYVAVPMLKEERIVGGITIYRPEVRPFTQKQIDLVSTFASQAVIAIENVRLFKELEARTEALTKSVGQLTALGEVGQAISSSLDLETVLKTIVSHAVKLTGLDGGSIYEFDEQAEEFNLRATENVDEEYLAVLRSTPIRKGEGAVGRAALAGEPVQIPDVQDSSYKSRLRDALIRAGYRAVLVVPLRREEHTIGALSVTRKTPGAFAPEVVELLKTFATQSAMAIQNARLFREIAEKGKQLEVASQHKSQFLASMSHELRTPLNAILGFNEMILDQVYGEVSPDVKAPLENIQASGKHLLRLINNVLDLAKIEAGRMELALADYAVQDAVESVRQTLLPLAAEKGLELLAILPADLPLAFGDPGRIAQCLMNLAGNSLKFTKAGKVEISVAERDSLLTFRVADTGVGIPPDKIDSLFTEFKQTDATIASEYGGTGLGLSISKKFIEMHGGRIWVESELGKGSAFIFEIPLRVTTT